MFNKYNDILDLVIRDLKINLYGDHGIKHWERVYKNTKILADHYKVESEVFELFSILHDSKRENEYRDEEHGLRASLFTKQLLDKGLIVLNIEDSNRLLFACKNHTIKDKNNSLYKDLIVQICFDSDKLDLGRVGIHPDPKRMFTSYSKQLIK